MQQAEQLVQQILTTLSAQYAAQGVHGVLPQNMSGVGCWFTNFSKQTPKQYQASLLAQMSSRIPWGVLLFGLKDAAGVQAVPPPVT